MIDVYFDLNVFDRIEKKNGLDEDQRKLYTDIESFILDGEINCPYSNAHINDLLRGHAKNPSYIPAHLETLKRLTNNLCLVQYWGHNEVTWHYRDVNEFFQSALEGKEFIAKTFSDLIQLDYDKSGAFKQYLEQLLSVPLPKEFFTMYKSDPIFKRVYPSVKGNPTILSMAEDLYQFSINCNKDYSLYKALRTYINQSKAKLKNHRNLLKEVVSKDSEVPKYLTIDEAIETYTSKTKTSNNSAYQKITDAYVKIDLKGFKSDERFSNMIDDSLHVFYGAHCKYFVTNDDRCHYKACEVYHKLGIETKALKPVEFLNLFNEERIFANTH